MGVLEFHISSARKEPGAESQPLKQQENLNKPSKPHCQACTMSESVFSLMWKWWGRKKKKSMAHQNATGTIPATHRLCPQNYKITANRAFKGHTEEFRQLEYYTINIKNKLMWWGEGAVLEYILWLVSTPNPCSEAIILYNYNQYLKWF